ncbi:hypothetical protein SAMN04487996_111321 [Dyadobacter soli]|uniref:VOC domain-containing protein n=1 Tax=Dyadobacter soli TaxID=659014 RepID=A0A1G7MMV6_9BACT|nr:VOC family protein [Dyadobacter soli]SDF62946.1 hypothetical protein SAMN04487996_111321 [Dyadobacter soli]
MIDQRITVLTLAADDLPRMRNFYEGALGWKPVAANDDIAFYQMNGFLLSITGRKFIAELIGISPEGSGFRGTTISYNVATEQQVRDIYDDLKSKGVKILTAPTAPPFGGLYFYFQDVESNVLEVACNDFIPMDADGNALGHKPIDQL